MARTMFAESVKVVFPIAAVVFAVGVAAMTLPGAAWALTCPSGGKTELPEGGGGQDLEVTGTCTVGAGDNVYGNVNIFGTADRPAMLKFKDARITFFSARSILVENHGHFLAGWSTMRKMAKPIGTRRNGRLTIRLYGAPSDPPIACKSRPSCAVDPAIWNANADPMKPPVETPTLPGGPECFYNYDYMPYGDGQQATTCFGTKVLATSA